MPPLFHQVLETSQSYANADRLMYVVGATRPEQLGEARKKVPQAFLLVPGVGAQGGSVEEVARFGLNGQCGLLVNSSRGILYAAGPAASIDAAKQASAAEAASLAGDMRRCLEAKGLV